MQVDSYNEGDYIHDSNFHLATTMPDSQTTPFVQPGDLLPDFLRSFWQRQVDTAEQETPDFRHPPLPLARIKKVMKSDPEVKVRLKYHSIKID